MNKKIVSGCILSTSLLILLSIAPSIYADTTQETDEEEYVEILTFIKSVSSDFIVHNGLIIKNVTITAVVGLDWLEISGYRWQNGRIRSYAASVIRVHASRFIGFWVSPGEPVEFLYGLAFGDIEYKI